MSETMKAAIFVEPGKMTVEEVPKAMLEQDDDIVIRVVRTCVCGSDLWFFRGLSGQAAHSQVGHESIGVVEEVGAAVESVKPGDFVVVPFPYSCGKCPVCKAAGKQAKLIAQKNPRTGATSPLVRPNTCAYRRRTAPWSRCPVRRKTTMTRRSLRC